jgi:hypothetical protein
MILGFTKLLPAIMVAAVVVLHPEIAGSQLRRTFPPLPAAYH